MTKLLIRKRAEDLRRSGFSYSYIAEQTGVSKGTLSVWLSRIPYVPNKMTVERLGNARAASAFAKHKTKLESLNNAQLHAKRDIGRLSERDIFMLGTGLYIGEGMKNSNSLRIINADPRVICFALKWFTAACGLAKDNFKIRVHLYPDTPVSEAIDFWSRATGLPKENFHKCQVDRRKGKKATKKGKLPYGTAHLSVLSNGNKEHGAFLARRVNGWLNEVLEPDAGLI